MQTLLWPAVEQTDFSSFTRFLDRSKVNLVREFKVDTWDELKEGCLAREGLVEVLSIANSQLTRKNAQYQSIERELRLKLQASEREKVELQHQIREIERKFVENHLQKSALKTQINHSLPMIKNYFRLRLIEVKFNDEDIDLR